MSGRAKVAVREAQGMMAVSFADAMAMMKDEKKAEDFFSKLESLKVEINEGIQKTASVKEIDRLLLQARANQNMTAEELEGARKEAKESVEQIKKDAKSWSDDLRKKTVERENAVAVVEKTLAEDKSRFNADAVAWQAAKSKYEAELADQKQLTARKLDEAGELKKRYETALASMKAGVAAA